MKRLLFSILVSVCGLLITPSTILANTIDTSSIRQGIVTVSYSGDLSNAAKVMVEKNTETYTYTIRDNATYNIPLQMGTGLYKVTILKGLGGTSYLPVDVKSFDVTTIDEGALYTSSIVPVDFRTGPQAISSYDKLVKGLSSGDTVAAIYKDIVQNYSYDFDMVSSLVSDYVPKVDSVYAKKKGICYDYSSLLATALRNQGVPTRLVMGYAPNVEEYHAWNQVFFGGKWYTVDTTTDAQFYRAKLNYSMAKDSSKFKVVKVY